MTNLGLRMCGLVAALCACATMASADTERVLVLPTQIGGPIPEKAEWRKEFDERLLESMRKSRRTPRLASGGTACEDVECAGKLAELEDVEFLVAGKVLLDASRPPSYRIILTVFDRAKGLIRREEGSCPVCSEFQAAELLATLGSRTIDEGGRATQPSEARPVVVSPTLPSTTPQRREGSPARDYRVPLYATMTAVGAAGLVASLVGLGIKASQNDETECAAGALVSCRVERDTTKGIAATATVAVISFGVGVAGAVLLGVHRKGAK